MLALFYANAETPPTTIETTGDLESLQGLVGGLIELVRLDNFDLYCNEEGLILGLPCNRVLPDGQVICGPFVVLKSADEDSQAITTDEAAWLQRNLP